MSQEFEPVSCKDCPIEFPRHTQSQDIVGNMRCILGREEPTTVLHSFFVQLQWEDETWNDWNVKPLTTEDMALRCLDETRRKHASRKFRLIVRAERQIVV